MKHLALVLLLSLSVSVYAATLPYMLMLDYAAPTERENGVAITQDEIAGYKIWYVPCEPLITALPELSDDYVTNVRSYWFGSLNPEQCLVFVTVDTDGRESVYSEVFRAIDFRAPQAATCTI